MSIQIQKPKMLFQVDSEWNYGLLNGKKKSWCTICTLFSPEKEEKTNFDSECFQITTQNRKNGVKNSMENISLNS